MHFRPRSSAGSTPAAVPLGHERKNAPLYRNAFRMSAAIESACMSNLRMK